MKKGLAHIYLLGLVLLVTVVLADYSSDYQTNLDNAIKFYCNRETAYSTGVSDARKGLARKADFAQICSVNREVYDAAYMSGYSFGLTNQSGLIVNEPAPAHPDIQNQYPASTNQPYTRPPQSGDTTSGSGTSGPYGGPNNYNNGYSRSPINPGEQAVRSGDLAQPYPTHGLKTLIEVVPSSVAKCIETANGQACGFNCVNSLNNVRCSSTPDQICRSNVNGDIACGYHCIATSKTVRCAPYSTDMCISDTNGYVFCGQNCRITGNAIGVCDVERYAP